MGNGKRDRLIPERRSLASDLDLIFLALLI